MIRRLMIIAAVLLFVAPAARAGDVRIWPTAAVSGREVRLGDIAEFSGFDAAITQRLTRLTLRPVPAAGAAEVIRIDDVRAALDGERINLAEVRLCGASRCEVSGPAPRPGKSRPPAAAAKKAANEEGFENVSRPTDVRVKAASTKSGTLAKQPAGAAMASADEPDADAAEPGTLEDHLRREIARMGASLGGRVEIRFGVVSRAALALREPECRFKITPRGENKLGMVWLDVDIEREGHKPQTVAVMADVTLMRPVVIASGIVNTGQEIAARDVRVEARAFKKVEDIGLTDPALAIGMESRRALHPGDMLRPRDVRLRPLVRRNQLVTVWSRGAGLVVQTAGRALAEGTLGEVVEVRSEGSAERFFATVTGPATVSVSETRATAVAQATEDRE